MSEILQLYAVIFGAYAAIIGALVVAISAARSVRRTNTLDLIIKHESDAFYNQIAKTFAQQVKSSHGLAYKKGSSQTKFHIHSYLNYFETIAVGIYDGALDEIMCKRYMRSMIFKTFEDAKNYVYGLRKAEKNKQLFIEFERLYNKWKQDKNFQKPLRRWI